MSSKEFLVFKTDNRPDSMHIHGIVNKGNITLGDEFLFGKGQEILNVIEIKAYKHKIESLPQGMSGELIFRRLRSESCLPVKDEVLITR